MHRIVLLNGFCFYVLTACILLCPVSVHAIIFLQTGDSGVSKKAVMFLDCRFCRADSIVVAESKKPQKESSRIVRLHADGRVVSSNPVWNVCVSGKPISVGLLRRNRDVFEYRRGHMHVFLPYTCRDYHRGNVALWKHPDFEDLELMLDSRGRLLSGIPAGFIAVRNKSLALVDRE